MFITFEGTDGSGKSTQFENLQNYLNEKAKSNDFEVYFTREPGAPRSPEAEKLRNLILDPKSEISPMTEAILYGADRRLNLENYIWPALEAGKIVVCDRHLDSSLAYQGGGRELGIERILNLQTVVTGGRFPDLTIFFDVDPAVSMQRVKDKNVELDRLEAAGSAFHKRVYDAYHELIKLFPERIKVINANQPKEKVWEELKEIIDLRLEL